MVSKDRRKKKSDRARKEKDIGAETTPKRESRLRKRRERYREKSSSSRERYKDASNKDVKRRIRKETHSAERRRLDISREAVDKRHEKESLSEKESRLAAARKNMSRRLENESLSDKEARLAALRENTSKIRTICTPESKKHELVQQRGRMKVRRSLLSEENCDERRKLDAWGKRLRRSGCTESPGQLLSASTSSHVAPEIDFNLTPTSVNFIPSRAASRFAISMETTCIKECSNCKERGPQLVMQNAQLCRRCNIDRNKFSNVNNMDPGELPEVFRGITFIEGLLISQVRCMMHVYRLPHGQIGYKGHVISFHQDVQGFINELPRHPKDLDVIVVRQKGAHGSGHKDWRVRKSKILGMLLWLKSNNPEFRDIVISEKNLAVLPDDGELDFHGFEAEEVEECANYPAHFCPSDADDEDDETSFVPARANASTEAAHVNRVVADMLCTVGVDKEKLPINMPTVNTSNPINEFKSPGYIVRAFPWLFSCGKADYCAARPQKVYPYLYFRHLMLYRDRRFCKDPIFPYFALNSTLRWRALQTGNTYIRLNPEDARLTAEDLKLLPRAELAKISNKMLRFGRGIAGSRAFWKSRRSELLAMISQLGMPHAFFTLSAADMHWPDLHRLIPNYPNKREALKAEPLVADWFFQFRAQEYIRSVLMEDFGVEDYWGRIEFQHRGSPHMHGVLWLKPGVCVEDVLNAYNADADRSLKLLIESIVTTWNPALDAEGNGSKVPPTINPCEKWLSDILKMSPDQLLADYWDMTNTVERHTVCKEGYCLRPNKDGVLVCSFKFPFDLCAETTLSRTKNDSGVESFEYVTKRNDPRVNTHNRTMLQTWRANCDIQFIVNYIKLVCYIVKYATKEEARSVSFSEFFHAVLKEKADFTSVRNLVHNVLLKIVGERDISKPEAVYLLMGFKLVQCSRVFVHLNTSGEREVDASGESDNVIKANQIDLYLQRKSPDYDNVSMFTILRDYTLRKDRNGVNCTPRKPSAIVCVHPYLPSDPDGVKHEEFCKQALILHQPFRDVLSLKGTFDSYADARKSFYAANPDVPLRNDFIQKQVDNPPAGLVGNDEDFDPADYSDDEDVEEWMLLCRVDPNIPEKAARDAENVDWTADSTDFDLDGAKRFAAQRPEIPLALSRPADVDLALLNPEQMRAYKVITEASGPVRLIVYGAAGTGKSYLIMCLLQHFGNRAKLMAPTGKAASNIGGQTLHSGFTIRSDTTSGGGMVPLSGDALSELQQEQRHNCVFGR